MPSHDSCVDLLLHIAGQLLEQHLELVETSLNQRPIEVVAGKPVRASRFKLTESRHSFDGAAELSSLGVNLRNCASDDPNIARLSSRQGSGNSELLHLGEEGGALEAKPGRGALGTANDPVRFRERLNDIFAFGVLQGHGP